MSQGKYKKKRKNSSIWRYIFILIILIFLLFRSLPSLLASVSKTTLAEEVTIEDKIDAKAIILRKERLYRAKGDGKIDLLKKEGERVPKGSKLAVINLLDHTSSLMKRLEEVDGKIDLLTKTQADGELIKDDEAKVMANIDSLGRELQENISHGRYGEVEILRDKLSIYNEKRKSIGKDKSLVSQSLDNLLEIRNELENQISSNTINYYAEESGIISYRIDGYEGIYSINYMEHYNFDDLGEIDENRLKIISNNDNVSINESIFKIIDNFEWFMLIKIDNYRDISIYEEGDTITISTKEIDKELRGKIERINNYGKKALLVVKFNTNFHNFYEKRLVDISIIKNTYDGFKIPTKAIVEWNNIKGVFIKEISGIVGFRPIEIIREDENYVYISKGNQYANIQINGSYEWVRTIRPFDEILLNPINIKEGMIIN